MSIITENPHLQPRIGVLLIHGLTGTPNEMRHVAKGLSKQGFVTHSVTLAGHCGSEADLLATGWRDWFASVEAAAEALGSEVDHLFVGGLSMGSVLSLKYAIEHPDKVSGLLCYGTTFFYDGWSIPPIARLSFLLPVLQTLGISQNKSFQECFPYGLKNERLRKSVSEAMLSGDSQAAGLPGNPYPSLAEFYRLSWNVQRELNRVRAPTLVVHAREDDVASLRNAQKIEREISGSVETLILTDSYHLITLDQQKSLVIRRSIDFIQNVVADRVAAEARASRNEVSASEA